MHLPVWVWSLVAIGALVVTLTCYCGVAAFVVARALMGGRRGF